MHIYCQKACRRWNVRSCGPTQHFCRYPFPFCTAYVLHPFLYTLAVSLCRCRCIAPCCRCARLPPSKLRQHLFGTPLSRLRGNKKTTVFKSQGRSAAPASPPASAPPHCHPRSPCRTGAAESAPAAPHLPRTALRWRWQPHPAASTPPAVPLPPWPARTTVPSSVSCGTVITQHHSPPSSTRVSARTAISSTHTETREEVMRWHCLFRTANLTHFQY